MVIDRAGDLLDQPLCGAHVVEISKFFLQPLQPSHQGDDLVGLEQAAKELRHIAELFDRDASLVAFVLRELGETLAPLSCLAPAPLD